MWTSEGASLAKKMITRVHELDATRPTTQAFPGTTSSANADAVMSQLDVSGYNYNLAQNQADNHQRVPTRVMMTTESFPADAFEQWTLTQDHPYILGEFVWTAMDYLGESGIGAWYYGTSKEVQDAGKMGGFIRSFMASFGADGKNIIAPFQNGQPPSPSSPGWPWHGAYCGDIDLTGRRKPISFYRDILWNGGDHVYVSVRLPETEDHKLIAGGWTVMPTIESWTWPGREGQPFTVELYSKADSVRLLLNGRSLGEKPTGKEQQFKADFEVPYEPGTLTAQAIRLGQPVAEMKLATAGQIAGLHLTADHQHIAADGEDLSFVVVEAVDAQGNPQPNAEGKVHFAVNGEGVLAAVGNGDPSDSESYAGDSFQLLRGRALAIVRSSHNPGEIMLTASQDGLPSSSTRVKTSELPAAVALK